MLFNALEQASLIGENDPFVGLLEPGIFKNRYISKLYTSNHSRIPRDSLSGRDKERESHK